MSSVTGGVVRGVQPGGEAKDLSGYGRADLTFGVEGEDVGDGLLRYVPGNSTGPGYADMVVLAKTMPVSPTGARLGQTLTP